MNKQIEEITNELVFTSSYGTYNAVAEHLYNAGYRKSTDVANEIISAFKEMTKAYLLKYDLYLVIFKNALNHAEAELKKKYESEGAEDV